MRVGPFAPAASSTAALLRLLTALARPLAGEGAIKTADRLELSPATIVVLGVPQVSVITAVFIGATALGGLTFATPPPTEAPTPDGVFRIDRIVMHCTPPSGTSLLCFNAEAIGVSKRFHVPDYEYSHDQISIPIKLDFGRIPYGAQLHFFCHLDGAEVDVCMKAAEDKSTGEFNAGSKIDRGAVLRLSKLASLRANAGATRSIDISSNKNASPY